MQVAFQSGLLISSMFSARLAGPPTTPRVAPRTPRHRADIHSSLTNCMNDATRTRDTCRSRLRWRNQDGQHHGCQHDARNDMETAGIRSTTLPHVRNQEWSKRTRRTPGCEHKAVNGTDILRSEVVGGKGRHSAESPAIAHQDDERQDCKSCHP